MEVPSGLNSYRRLLIYRLSERFGLIHSTSDYPNEVIHPSSLLVCFYLIIYSSLKAGEKIIYLNRTENTYIPTVLLIDLKPKESVENNRMNDESNNSPNSPGNMSVTSSEQSTSQKKVLVMKRHPNHHRNLHTKTNVKNQITVEEKEKAYNEARARIFGESSPGIEGNTLVNDSNEPVNPTNTPSTSVNPSLNQSNRIDIPSQTSNTRPIVPETKNTQPVPQHMPSQTSHNKHKPVNVSTWKEKKGQIRNIESEKYDPDFVRRSNVQPVAVNNNMFVSNPTGYPQSYRQMPPQQMNYQAYPMMQGQPMPGNWVYSPNPYAAYDPYSMQQQGYYGEMQPPQAYYSQQAYPTGSIPPQPPSNGSNPPNRSFQQDFPPLS